MRTRQLAALAALAFMFALAGPAAAAPKKGKKSAKIQIMVLKIDGLSKATKGKAIKKLEKTVKKVKGVALATASKKKGELTVRHKPAANVEEIKAAVAKAGFKIVEPKKEPVRPSEPATDSGEVDDELPDDVEDF